MEAPTGTRWIPYDPEGAYAEELPASYVVARVGGSGIAGTTGAETRLSILAVYPLPPGLVSNTERNAFAFFDLWRFPPGAREALSLLLILPLGALITSVCRNLIGLMTFGTFTPALLALSFIYSEWITGLLLLVTVLLLGFGSRLFLDRLQLLKLPRLSVLLTLVVLCMVHFFSAAEFLGITTTTGSVLLPIVILTMIIERAHNSLVEESFRATLLLSVSTMAVAALCYLLLRWKALGNLLLTFPEIHFLTMAALLWIGRYGGYRLTELWRFRDLTAMYAQESPR
jgi:hypothetical protein